MSNKPNPAKGGPPQEDGKLTPDPKKGSDSNKPQQQKNYVRTPQERSD